MATSTPTLAVLPLIYTYVDTVVGRGFLAKVSVKGLLLAREEACESGATSFWLEGVQPAGMADTGSTLNEAYVNFRRAFTGVLFDMASDAKDFSDFRSRVHAFGADKLAVGLDEWLDACRANRAAGLTGDKWGIETIHLARAEAEVSVEEIRPQQLQPAVNELDPAPRIAA